MELYSEFSALSIFDHKTQVKKERRSAQKYTNENRLIWIHRELIGSKLVTHRIIVIPNLRHALR